MRYCFGLLFLPCLLLVLVACAPTVDKRTEAEALVDNSRWTIEHFKRRSEEPNRLFRSALKDASGVLIFPNVIKGGFFFGAEGGPGILVVRNGDGQWGYPAFYGMGAGSFGLQVGAQSAEVVYVLRTPGAVNAVISHQGKLGGDMQATVGNVGAGLEASTTTNVGADIVGFSHAQGVYAGLSVEGAVIGRRPDLNEAYYGPGANTNAIVRENRFWNVQADPLRVALAGE